MGGGELYCSSTDDTWTTDLSWSLSTKRQRRGVEHFEAAPAKTRVSPTKGIAGVASAAATSPVPAATSPVPAAQDPSGSPTSVVAEVSPAVAVTAPEGTELYESRGDGLCLPDSLAVAITMEKGVTDFRITAEQVLHRVIAALVEIPSLELARSLLPFITEKDTPASAWALSHPDATDGFDTYGLPTSMSDSMTPAQLSQDFRGWLSLILHKTARFHYKTFPDVVFEFLAKAAALLYSTPDLQLHCCVLGDTKSCFQMPPPGSRPSFCILRITTTAPTSRLASSCPPCTHLHSPSSFSTT